MALVVGTNSYIDVTDADTYFEDDINAAVWKAASPETKSSALVSATKMLDRQRWTGTKTDQAPTQVLDWPRTGVVDCSEGTPVDPNTVPQNILAATCELGKDMIEDNALEDQANTGSNIKSLGAGSASIEYFNSTESTRFPTVVNELIGCWLEGANSNIGAFVSGAGGCPQIEDYDRTKGVY